MAAPYFLRLSRLQAEAPPAAEFRTHRGLSELGFRTSRVAYPADYPVERSMTRAAGGMVVSGAGFRTTRRGISS